MYKNLSLDASAHQWGDAATGVTTQDAAGPPRVVPAQHAPASASPPWSYDWVWAADIGNRALPGALGRQRPRPSWTAGTASSWTTPTRRCGTTTTPRRSPSTRPTRRTRAATGSALAAIGPRIRAAGKLVIPNMGTLERLPLHRQRLAAVRLRRHGGAVRQVGHRPRRRATSPATAGSASSTRSRTRRPQGKLFLAISHSAADGRRRRPLRLGDDAAGRRTATPRFALADDYTNETWFPEYDYDLGSADRRPRRQRRAASTAACSSAGSCSSTRRRRRVAVRFGGRYSGSGLTAAQGADASRPTPG